MMALQVPARAILPCLLKRSSALSSGSFNRELQTSSSSWAATGKTTYNVPEGHQNSDLSNTVCHIGLGRRRDLTMRQDLRLHQGGKEFTLADVFGGSRALLVGFPGGKICSEQHIPAYVKAAAELSAAGVDKVVAVTVDQPEAVEKFAAQQGLQPGGKVEVYADPSQAFVRLLGLELPPGQGPACQRFAAVVDNGILLRLAVEQSPGELLVSDVKSMLGTWKQAYA